MNQDQEQKKGPTHTVAVDFDGVIHTYHGWKGDNVFDQPIPGADDFLFRLAMRYNVIIHTTRNRELVWTWLKTHRMEHLVVEVTDVKPLAVAYVDDRAVRFNGDFEEVMRDIDRKPWWKEGGTK